MIIDHRTYTAHPGKLPAFLKAYEELGFALQTKHLGNPVGWYISMDIAARRAKLAAEPGWAIYLKEATPFLQKMENKILTVAPFFKP